MELIGRIEELLKENFSDASIQINDLTGTGDHLEINIQSQAFEGKRLLEQHRMVMDVLKIPLGQDLHAVKLKTSTP